MEGKKFHFIYSQLIGFNANKQGFIEKMIVLLTRCVCPDLGIYTFILKSIYEV